MSKTIAEQIEENEALQNKYKNNPNEYFFGTSSDSGKVKEVKSDKQEEADTFRSRFASNMADYFKDNPDAFKFISTP